MKLLFGYEFPQIHEEGSLRLTVEQSSHKAIATDSFSSSTSPFAILSAYPNNSGN